MNSSPKPITVKRLTAAGRGAVAVLRVDARDDIAAQVLDSQFVAKNGMQASQAEIGRILYGDWGPEDVVVVRVAALRWEVNCHGGEVAASRISTDLLGDETAPQPTNKPADFEEHFEDRFNAALTQRLLSCRTKQTARFLLAQQQGVLLEFLRQLQTATGWDDCRDAVEECLRWEEFSRHLTTPWQVAIVGQPNAGKSSLLNTIVGFDRSIVFDQPGTTRDRVEADIVLGGWPFRLIDTAGIRENAHDKIETVGVEAARASLRDADACVLVVDAVCGWSDADRKLLEQVPANCPCVIAFNKVDLPASAKEVAESELRLNRQATVLRTSAANDIGIDELTDWLPNQLVPAQPKLQTPLPVVDEVREALSRCLAEESLSPLKPWETLAIGSATKS